MKTVASPPTQTGVPVRQEDASVNRETKSVHPLVALGATALVGGLVAWVWLSEWRWAVTGLGVLLVSVVIAAVRTKRQA